MTNDRQSDDMYLSSKYPFVSRLYTSSIQQNEYVESNHSFLRLSCTRRGIRSLPPRVICAPGTVIDLQTISNWPIWSALTRPMSVLDPFTYVADWSGVLFFFSNVIPWRMVPTTWYKVPLPFEPFSTKIAIWLGLPRYSTV
jgi:hypothetical protein